MVGFYLVYGFSRIGLGRQWQCLLSSPFFRFLTLSGLYYINFYSGGFRLATAGSQWFFRSINLQLTAIAA